jgi:hypothetical protein
MQAPRVIDHACQELIGGECAVPEPHDATGRYGSLYTAVAEAGPIEVGSGQDAAAALGPAIEV